MEARLLWESESLVAAWKPPAMHSAPRPGPDPGESLAGWVALRVPACAAVEGRNPGEGGLLHRLDFLTSGLVLFAKTQEAYAALLKAQAAGLFAKDYEALCRRRPALALPEGIAPGDWEGLLAGKAPVPPGLRLRSRFRPFGEGSREVRPLASGAEGRADRKSMGTSLYETEILALEPGARIAVRARIRKGFRHQVRAHLAWIGLPIEGDPLYGEGFSPFAKAAEEDPLAGGAMPRLKLHARRIAFPYPDGGETIALEAPLPEDWLDL